MRSLLTPPAMSISWLAMMRAPMSTLAPLSAKVLMPRLSCPLARICTEESSLDQLMVSPVSRPALLKLCTARPPESTMPPKVTLPTAVMLTRPPDLWLVQPPAVMPATVSRMMEVLASSLPGVAVVVSVTDLAAASALFSNIC